MPGWCQVFLYCGEGIELDRMQWDMFTSRLYH
jgi:hypothetical protein